MFGGKEVKDESTARKPCASRGGAAGRLGVRLGGGRGRGAILLLLLPVWTACVQGSRPCASRGAQAVA